jgi:hypothetical protein
VLIEEEARDRYEELPTQLVDFTHAWRRPTSSAMARIEELHRRQLTERRRERFGDRAGRPSRDDDLRRRGARLRRSARVHDRAPGARVGPAAASEGPRILRPVPRPRDDPEVRALFEELREEELEHQEPGEGGAGRAPGDDPGARCD